MNKLKFLIAYGLKKRFLKKSFLISNIVILLLTIVIINIPTIINIFESDESNLYVIQVVTDEQTTAFKTPLEQTLTADSNLPFVIEFADVFDEALFFNQASINMAILLSSDSGPLQVDLFRFETTYDSYVLNAIQLLDVLNQNENYVLPTINVYLPDTYEDPMIQEIISSISIVFVLPLFIILVLAIQFVGVDIIEEKSSKAIETIISSVPAMIHFISKIISSLLFILGQGILLILYGSFGSLVSSTTQNVAGIDNVSLMSLVREYFPNIGEIITVSILFIIVGAIFYLIFAAIIAASATTQEDYQQFQAPIMITLVVGFYVAIFSSAAGAFQILRIASF
ncbi:MAG: ABC transporter permease, partial [Acholeplasmataceae bacterium]